MVSTLKNKCSVWKRIKFRTFRYNCYYFTWSDTYFIQLETLLINHPSYMFRLTAVAVMFLITEIRTGNVKELRCWLQILKTRLQLDVTNYTTLGHCFHLPPRGQCVVTGVLVKYTSCGNRALTCGASVMDLHSYRNSVTVV